MGPTVYWKVLIVEEKYYNIAVLKTIKNDIKWLENRGCKEKKKIFNECPLRIY